MKMRSRVVKLVILTGFLGFSQAHAVDVVFLTQQGPSVSSKILKSWTPEELSKLAKSGGSISAQSLIIDESTQSLDLNDRADIDLVTLYGEKETARVPRFLLWRGLLKLTWDKKSKTLSSRGQVEALVPNRLLIPPEAFRVYNIQKIELAQHSWVYPGTRLTLRTNPAASRGEKLYTQSCLACHSLPGFKAPLQPAQLTGDALKQFAVKHKAWPKLVLDARAVRGLAAYRDALATEKTVLPSSK
jgi:hypothetical protein